MNVTVWLAALDSTDIGVIRAWRNDYKIWRYCRQNDLISDAEQVRWFNRQSEDPTIKMYKLMAKTDEKEQPALVGVGGLTSVDHFNSRAELSFYLCPDMQGRGVDDSFLAVLLGHAFENLGLGLVYAETFDGNPIREVLARLGFTYEGRRRRFYWKDGKRIDAHLYSLTAEEWHDLRRRHTDTSANASGAEPVGPAETANVIDVTSGIAPESITDRPGGWSAPKARRQQRRGVSSARAGAEGQRGD